MEKFDYIQISQIKKLNYWVIIWVIFTLHFSLKLCVLIFHNLQIPGYSKQTSNKVYNISMTNSIESEKTNIFPDLPFYRWMCVRWFSHLHGPFAPVCRTGSSKMKIKWEKSCQQPSRAQDAEIVTLSTVGTISTKQHFSTHKINVPAFRKPRD